MRFKAAYYEEIFREVYKRFGIDSKNIPRSQWVSWQAQVKKMFEEGILIKEILAALDGAAEKKKWPVGVGFWKRVEDIVYLNRKEQKHVKIGGMNSLKDLLKK